MTILHTIYEWLNLMPKSENRDLVSLDGDDYTLLSKDSLISLLKVRDQQIATYEHLLRNNLYSSSDTAQSNVKPTSMEVEPKVLALNKLNRANIRTIGAILSNRS